MKKITHYLCCSLVLSGVAYSFAESDNKFQSLKTRSPFGDAAPKPVVKPAVQKKATEKIAEQPKPKKPELNLSLTGVVDINGKKYFSVSQKTPKEVFFEVLTLGEKSPQGKLAKKFNEKKNLLTIEVNGFDYDCVLGEDNSKKTSGTNSNSGNYSRNLPDNPVNGNRSTYEPYSNYELDDWGDWDDDDWDDWDF